MPLGFCQANGQFTIEKPLPDFSGKVLCDVQYTWDGTSVWPQCDGPITSLHTRNTGDMPAWAMLPDKRNGDPWIKIDPGTDVTTTAKGQLNNLGIVNASDAIRVDVKFKDPTIP
jgi:hypothetical protein